MCTANQRKIARIVPALLSWFGQTARDLPWRRSCDPYAIWVSEIMLQQTQVKTVIPFWERWMQSLPTIEALAKAPSATIHKLWEGLGYYTRVRNLQRAAQLICERHQGRFPEQFEAVLELPGVGRYTAGAICSIAFNQPRPILDGNVIRVVSRLFGIRGNVHEAQTKEQLWALAEQLVADAESRNHPLARKSAPCSWLNQSLMELGALVCIAKAPRCRSCPVRKQCVAHKENLVDQLPALAKPIPATRRRFAAFVARHQGKFLVRQRAEGIVNAHLWEFPNVEVSRAENDWPRLAQAATGLKPHALEHLFTVKHSITRYRIELEVFRIEPPKRRVPVANAARWLSPARLRLLAFPSAHKKILKHVLPGEN